MLKSGLLWIGPIALACLSAVAYGRQAGQDLREPQTYQSPLVQLQRLDGRNTHLHVDEVRLRSDGLLLQCSYTFGIVDTTDAEKMRYLAQNLRHTIPGDNRTPGCIHLAWDGDIVYTTHRGNIRNPAFLTAWDITKREAPVQLPALQEPGVSYEGVDTANGNIFVGLHEKGLGVYRRDASNQISRIGTALGFSNAWGVAARGNSVFVADGVGGLVTVDVTDPAKPRVLGRVETGGQARGEDRGLAMVSLNAHDAEERTGEVHQYADNIRVTFPLGLEQTQTYAALTQNFVGFNPFPVDVVVGKDGRIAYIAREYDPDALVKIIEKLLAQ